MYWIYCLLHLWRCISKGCVTLPAVYCRPFASKLAFWAILKNFKLAVYSSIPHLRQKGQKVDNTPSEASGKYNTITVKSQTVTKADCVGALWCLLVLNLAVACQRFRERWGGRRGEVSFSSHTLPLPPFFFFAKQRLYASSNNWFGNTC